LNAKARKKYECLQMISEKHVKERELESYLIEKRSVI
jgi:hypothetical protein